jgi:hypothetical protein
MKESSSAQEGQVGDLLDAQERLIKELELERAKVKRLEESPEMIGNLATKR